MKTFKLLVIFISLITISRVEAQNTPSKPSLGIVTYTKQSRITDTAAFNKTSTLFAKNMVDSLTSQMMALKTKLGEDTSGINAASAPFKNLMLEEVFKTETPETHIDEFQKDKIVNFVIEGEGNKTGKFYFNHADNLVYNSYNSEEIEDYFESEDVISLKEYRTEKKLIKGYNCFKIIYVYREKTDNEEFQMPEMIIEREMWVTDKIIAPFHSVIRSPQILSKYYPLEITEKMSKVDGFETKYLLENISLK
jgi:hypothetical protein